MRKYSWLPLVFTFLIPASAAGQVKLAWRFKQGDRFYVEETTKVLQTIKIMDTETRQDLEQTKVSRFAVLKTDREGAVLEQTIQSVKIKHSGDGPDIDTKVLKQLVGASFQVTLDARGQVIKLSGYDALLKAIARDDPLNVKVVRALVTEESFKVALVGLFGWLPEKTVAKGDSWEHRSVLPVGPLGTLNLDSRYALEDIDEAEMLAKVSATSKGTYAPPEKAPDPALKISGGEIRLLSSAGKVVFDAAHGRLSRSDLKTRLEGTLQVMVGDATVTMQFEQDGERKIHVYEKQPKTGSMP